MYRKIYSNLVASYVVPKEKKSKAGNKIEMNRRDANIKSGDVRK